MLSCGLWGAENGGEDCPASHFNEQMLTINLDFCGDWAGNVFPGGLEACNAYVEDPANAQALSDAGMP